MVLGEKEIEKKLSNLKIMIREKEVPFFDDMELKFHLDRSGYDTDLAAYQCLIIKAEKCSFSVSGLSIADSSEYWLRLAGMYRPCSTTVMGGG